MLLIFLFFVSLSLSVHVPVYLHLFIVPDKISADEFAEQNLIRKIEEKTVRQGVYDILSAYKKKSLNHIQEQVFLPQLGSLSLSLPFASRKAVAPPRGMSPICRPNLATHSWG
jgi:hypothetical protein